MRAYLQTELPGALQTPKPSTTLQATLPNFYVLLITDVYFFFLFLEQRFTPSFITLTENNSTGVRVFVFGRLEFPEA